MVKFQLILGFLSVLFVSVQGKESNPELECNAQAWVRAPDLAPNTVIQGDARVKVSAGCPPVRNATLGLRFKERSFVKALRSREDLKWLHVDPEQRAVNTWNTSPWNLTTPRFSNQTAKEAYREIVDNQDLWIVQEEERIVFEITQPFQDIEGGDNHAPLDAIQDFAILVPSTNFPPALDLRDIGFRVPGDTEEIRSIEWIYEYFAEISFANETMKEVPAGLTAFQPSPDPSHGTREVTSATIELELLRGTGERIAERRPVTNYSIEIIADSGLTFTAGTKKQVISAVVTRTGPARAFSEPLDVTFCVSNDFSGKWAAEYDIPDSLDSLRQHRTPTSVLRATTHGGNQPYKINRIAPCPGPGNSKVSVLMPDSTSDEIQAQEIVTTSSKPFTVSISVDDAHIFDFETYYQSLFNTLTARFHVWRKEDDSIDPDDPSAEPHLARAPGHQFEDDEEEWVPWTRTPKIPRKIPSPYMGRIPVVVRPAGEIPALRDCQSSSADMLKQAVLSGEKRCNLHSPVHYLDEGARGPIFVDHSTTQELFAEDTLERELRAPILRPVTTCLPQGEERIYRYYLTALGKQHVYVGETWTNKVAKRNKEIVSSDMRRPRITQSFP